MNRQHKLLAILTGLVLLTTGLVGVATASEPGRSPAPSDAQQGMVVGVPERMAPANSAVGAISYRQVVCGVHGDFQVTARGLGAVDGRPVAVTATEVWDGVVEDIGLARIRVNNVAVWYGVIKVWITVDWSTPICIAVHYLG